MEAAGKTSCFSRPVQSLSVPASRDPPTALFDPCHAELSEEIKSDADATAAVYFSR